jgi:hypothetical protein
MNENQENIRLKFQSIANDNMTLTPDELNEKYKDFKQSFPKLFQIASETTNVNESMRILDMMLVNREKQKDGTLSKTNSDMVVGNQLGKEFIYPITGMPTQKEFTQATKKIMKKANQVKQTLN